MEIDGRILCSLIPNGVDSEEEFDISIIQDFTEDKFHVWICF